MSELLASAFSALGASPSRRELALVADAVKDSGDEEALALLEARSDDRESWERLSEIAKGAGSSFFVALDLAVVIGSGIDALTRRSI